MKTFALIAAAAVAVSTANAAECVLTEIAVNFLDIVEDVSTCSDVTGYSMVPPSTNPTTQQAADICTKCSKLVAEAKKKTFPTCTFLIDGVETPLNEFFQKVVGSCGSSSGSSTGSSAGSKATATVGTTPAPATTTSKSSGSGSKASSSSSTVKTPAPTTATPKSAGVVATVSAAVVAVASVAAYAL
ncbi:Elicitin-like protein 6 precursor [Globisporangium polare]